MKSWRTLSLIALFGLSLSPAANAIGPCRVEETKIPTFPLVLCAERQNTTVGSGNISTGTPGAANIFPWTNNSSNFSSYRNQYLYKSSDLAKLANNGVCTIESIHSRAASFSTGGLHVHNYTGATNNTVHVELTTVTSLSTTFANNRTGTISTHLDYQGPKTVTMTSGFAVGSDYGATNTVPILSDFSSRGPDVKTRNDLTTIIDFRAAGSDPTKDNVNLLMDQIMSGTGGSGGIAGWDVTAGACSGPQRAYGSGSFANPNQHLTTALAVDNNAFVWVFRGLVAPGGANIQQQIAEIIRLLVTPEGLRCTGLDVTIDGKFQESAIFYGEGKDYDPISPRVTDDGVKTGEEAGEGGRRRAGFNH